MSYGEEERIDWVFTWGFGQEYPECYTIINGTYAEARQEMVRRHGLNWAFQYESKEKAGVDKYRLTEIKGESHEFYDGADFQEDPNLEGYLARVVIEGGLSVCKKCGLLEGSLTTHCPGVSAHRQYSDRIYKGEIDFICGQWVEACSRHTPVFYRDCQK